MRNQSSKPARPVLISLCLLVGLLLNAGAVHAQGITVPTAPATPATPTSPVVVFTEYDHTSTDALKFTVRTDGSAVLEITHGQDDQMQTRWLQPGKVTPEQLDAINALQPALSTAISQNQRDASGKDYQFIVPTADGNTRELWFSTRIQASNPAMTALLQNAVTILTDIRRPFETLVVFEWSGGFAARSTVLTIRNDGQVAFEDKLRGTSSTWQIADPDIHALRALVQADSFASFEPSQPSGCADCWEYTITAMTANGLHRVHLIDADLQLSPVPANLQQLIDSLRRLSKPQAQQGN